MHRFSRRKLLQGLTGSPVAIGGLYAMPSRAEQSVRIAVGRFRNLLRVDGKGLSLRGSDGAVLASDREVELRATARGITFGGKLLPYALLRVLGAGDLTLQDHTYRRVLEVHWREYRGVPELLVVHPLALETYVTGIVSSELPHRWPFEALKVQAVAARTYAVWQKYRRLDLPYHMESTVLDQVYHGAQREHEDARRAVAETHGQLLVYGRRPVQAYFHSACGGRTESAEEGWGTELAYLPGSPCGFCENASRYRWTARLPKRKVEEALHRLAPGPVTSIRVVGKTRSGRAKHIEIKGKTGATRISGAEFRRLCGYTQLWSTWLDELSFGGDGLQVRGRGAGHGVGMCQWGARGMAERGHSFEEALLRYYPGAALRRMY